MIHKLLFLCTANYYRSRFAELLFNARAARRQLNCIAESRGIATELGADNIGPIFAGVVEGLQHRGIAVGATVRWPIQVQEQDLTLADLIIALHEAEHRPYLQQRFPRWVDRVEYWHVPDLEGQSAGDALAAIEEEVNRLILRLAG